SSNSYQLTNIGGLLYFRASDGANGIELWRSDGTSSGTFLLAQVVPDSGDGSPQNFCEAGGTLFFTASDGATGRELWKLDGGLPPSITSNGGGTFATATTTEGGTAAVTVVASDPNGGTLTYSILGGAD